MYNKSNTSIGVWGIGYIGFSTMIHYASKGFTVIGYDVDKTKVTSINSGKCPIEINENWTPYKLPKDTDLGKAIATTNSSILLEENVLVHFIAVPSEKDGEIIDDCILSTMELLSKHKSISTNRPPVFIIESTLPPYKTQEIIDNLFVSKNLSPGKDFILGVAPRRDWVNMPEKSLESLPRVYGSTDSDSENIIRTILSYVCQELVLAKDYKHAEIVKPTENIIYQAQISIVNQLMLAFPEYDIDEVMKLVSTKWNMPSLYPSMGIGGYCIPLASKYLIKGTKFPENLTIISTVDKAHHHVADKIVQYILSKGINKVGILGLSYKENMSIPHQSPSIRLAQKLTEKRVLVKVNDPYFSTTEIIKITKCESFDFITELDKFDCLILVTSHREYNNINNASLFNKLNQCKLLINNTSISINRKFLPNHTIYKKVGDMTFMQDLIIENIPQNICVRNTQKDVVLNETDRNQIEKFWNKINSNNNFYRDSVHCVEKIEKTDEGIIIDLNKSDYAHYLYTLKNKTPLEKPCIVTFIVGLIETSDNKFVIAKMGNHTSTPYRLQCPGGGLDSSDIKDGIFDLRNNLYKEVKEEIGIDINQENNTSKEPYYKYLKSGGNNGFIGIIAKIDLAYTGDETKNLFNAHQISLIDQGLKPELDSLLVIEKGTINNIIKKYPELQHNSVDYLLPVINMELLSYSANTGKTTSI